LLTGSDFHVAPLLRPVRRAAAGGGRGADQQEQRGESPTRRRHCQYLSVTTRTLRALLCLSLPCSLFILFFFPFSIKIKNRSTWKDERIETQSEVKSGLHLYRSILYVCIYMRVYIVLQGLREHGVRVYSSDIDGLMDTTTEGSEAGGG